jgi:hypothetical protein
VANKFELPKNTQLAGKMLDEQRKERGAMGWLWGTKEHAPLNIAGFMLISCVLALVVVAFIVPDLVRSHSQLIVSSIFSLITLIVGYIFGRKTSDD